MKTYVCPQCSETFDALCGPVDTLNLDTEHENPNLLYFECPECGYRDEQATFIND